MGKEMTIGEKQEMFTILYCNLLTFLLGKGYRIRQKHLLRCAGCKVGHDRSLHRIGLAIDLVFMEGDDPIEDSARYTEAGEFWEHLGGSWGGRFGDGGHFSIEHNGVR